MKAVLFDLDDTLLATWQTKWACHKLVAEKYWGVELSDDVLAQHWGEPLTTLLANLYGLSIPPRERINRYLTHADDFAKGLLPGAVETVNELLDRGLEVGVVTSTQHALAANDLQRFQFPIDQLAILQGEDDYPAHKPDPNVFAPALEKLQTIGIALEDIAYVGDSDLDATAALEAGMQFVGVTTGVKTEKELRTAGATTVIPQLSDLLNVV